MLNNQKALLGSPGVEWHRYRCAVEQGETDGSIIHQIIPSYYCILWSIIYKMMDSSSFVLKWSIIWNNHNLDTPCLDQSISVFIPWKWLWILHLWFWLRWSDMDSTPGWCVVCLANSPRWAGSTRIENLTALPDWIQSGRMVWKLSYWLPKASQQKKR